MEDKLEKLLLIVTKEENKCYDLAYRELERNNTVGNMVMSAQASAFQRIRYTIEDMIEKGG
jgi:hypothetical protein